MTKIVVIGGTGLIGSKLVSQLSEQGNDAIAASPKSGVNTLTGDGLAEVLTDAQVVVDVSNSPSFDEKEVLNFFTTSTTNLLGAAAAAGVVHYVALSVVGTQRLAESPYFRAKIAQEKLIKGVRHRVLHRSCHSVLRIRPEHRGLRHGGRRGSPLARTYPADRR